MLDLLSRAEAIAKPWADLYNGSTPLQVTITYAHLGAMLVAGGFAVAADRSALRLRSAPPVVRLHHLEELTSLHAPVLIGLGVSAVSGVLLFAADVPTYGPSVVFWVKMGLILLLLANGARIVAAERRLRAGDPSDDALWHPLRSSAVASITLWLLIALAGAILPTLSNLPSR